MERKFTCDFRSAEAAASGPALMRAVYGNARWVYALASTAPVVLFFGVVVAGVYLGWWGEYYLLAVLGAAALVIIWSRLSTPWLRRKILKPSSGGEGRNIEYEFGEDGYRIRTETFDGFQKWAGVERIINARGAILFVLGLNAHFLPHRIFSSAAERGEFIDWVLTRLTPEAREKSVTRTSFDKASPTS